MSIFDNLLGGNLKEQEKIRTKEASLVNKLLNQTVKF